VHSTVSALPFSLFADWLADAEKSELNDANAMSVVSIDSDGQPSVRIVLLKAWSAQGFVFYTNHDSRKGVALRQNPKTCLNFHWKSLRRQIRIEGAVDRVSDGEADAYFASRARDSQIGAWASLQSQLLDRRETFEARLAEVTAQYAGRDVPRPPHWSGFRVVPDKIEFWQEIDFRLHHRRLFSQTPAGWLENLLYP
jgi:pyridoxamine 5'-phosphate oxidase